MNKACKRLESDLRGVVEDYTQGRYGRGDEVDIDALREDFEQAVELYEDTKGEDDDA